MTQHCPPTAADDLLILGKFSLVASITSSIVGMMDAGVVLSGCKIIVLLSSLIFFVSKLSLSTCVGKKLADFAFLKHNNLSNDPWGENDLFYHFFFV